MQFRITRRIEAAPDRVFDALTDFPAAPERIRGIDRIEMLTEGEVGVGTRFLETRIIMRRAATEEMEITAFEPGRSYALECTGCGCLYRTDITVRPDGNAAVVEMDMKTRPLTFFAKLMTPVGVLMSGPMKKCIAGDLDDIGTWLERGDDGT
jgi:carbon monoxide dehydrogenase subunit G